MAQRIKERCLALEPELLPPGKRGGTIEDLEVVQEAVGLRPTREGGIRIEAESIGAVPSRFVAARQAALTMVCYPNAQSMAEASRSRSCTTMGVSWTCTSPRALPRI